MNEHHVWCTDVAKVFEMNKIQLLVKYSVQIFSSLNVRFYKHFYVPLHYYILRLKIFLKTVISTEINKMYQQNGEVNEKSENRWHLDRVCWVVIIEVLLLKLDNCRGLYIQRIKKETHL